MPQPINGLIDVRGQLMTNAGGGPRAKAPLEKKWGVVIHYNGPAVDLARPVMDVIRSDAAFHVGRDWANPGDPSVRGDGLMYHIVVGPGGEKFLCRDLECVLWHCAAWPQNETALSVHVPIGEDQHATDAQIKALWEICDDWLAAGHGSRSQVWGHQELSPTNCPGTLMADFVRPYRANKRGEAAAAGEPDVIWFDETKHGIGFGFKDFWCRRGGLDIFGFPLTDELSEPDPAAPGGQRTVQYFERAVFEFHPEAPAGWTVQLRHLGREALRQKEAAIVA